MQPPFILPLQNCHDPSLVGGKALGLARLLAAGFPVPGGLCVTTTAYHQALETVGFSPHERWHVAIGHTGEERQRCLCESRALIQRLDVTALVDSCLQEMRRIDGHPARRWAVRSSATNEDAAHTSFAGLYRTELGVAPEGLARGIAEVWASLWDERVLAYLLKSGSDAARPAMAVILQPMLDALAAGVAYSIHPISGRSSQVTIDAVRGLGAPLVDGSVTPDQYVVGMDGADRPNRVRRRHLAHQSEQLVVRAEGLQKELLPAAEQDRSSLSEPQLFDIARLAKQIEHAFQGPVDMEWAIDHERLWVLQARPITAVRPSSGLTNDESEWSRANFKETMPELPSPLGLSFLERFMDVHITAHYRRLGCIIPEGVSAVRIVHGRPYLNITLMYALVVQMGGDPSILPEQMGGEQLADPPQVGRLSVGKLIRAGCLVVWLIQRAPRQATRWFAEMKHMAAAHSRTQVRGLSLDEIAQRLDLIATKLEARDMTFAIVGGVAQCLQLFGILLPRWLGEEWRAMLNGALQGQAQAVSAVQILRLAELVDLARGNDTVRRVLLDGPQKPADLRAHLQGTNFLNEFDRYLDDYGHRGIAESDIMSPRFSDQPEWILNILRIQLQSGTSHSARDIVARQEAVRNEALRAIRRRFGRRLHRRLVFSWCYRRLCRYSALREANRHHLMYYATAVRTLLQQAGAILVEQAVLDQADDIFYLRLDEQPDLFAGTSRDWRSVIRARKEERNRNQAVTAPDTIRVNGGTESIVTDFSGGDTVLRGTPISGGLVSGLVRIVRLPADWSKVQNGTIIVAPVIDPGMAPLFGIAGGMIVEMGGTLSHGAIIAREYGLPTITNVPRAMSRLKDGDLVELSADSGTVRRIAP